MSWLLMAGMTPDEREQYVDAVLLDGGFPIPPVRPAPEEPEAPASHAAIERLREPGSTRLAGCRTSYTAQLFRQVGA